MNKYYLELLAEFLKFRSISTDKTFVGEIEKTVMWLSALLETAGFTVNICRGYGNPIVVAEYTHDKKKETVLIYGHYDVQPAEFSDGWVAEPFGLSERNNRLYGRGVVDNKGQVLIHIINVLEMIKNKTLGFNVKFMLEGDEETGSSKMAGFVEENKPLLKSDFCLISDGEMNIGSPTIEAGFRGGFNSTLTLTTSNTDLHSGIYGGAVPSAAFEMAKILATLFDKSNKVAIEGFYDDVDKINDEVALNNEAILFDKKEYLKVAGVKSLLMEKEMTNVISQTGLRPTIQITGIQTGYVGEGYRNSIPGTATAKINFRLVKSQDNWKIEKLFRKHLKAMLPETVEYSFTVDNPFDGIKLDLSSEYVTRAKKILEEVYEAKTVFKFSGGGLPIATLISEIIGAPCVLVPLCNEDCRMHAVDENFDINYLNKAMKFSREFLKG